MTTTTTSTNQERPVLYINILVIDACEAVRDEVAAKVKKSRHIPKSLKSSVANRAAARVTWDVATATKVVDKMAPKLCQEIPSKTKKKGIQVHVDTVFQEGNYLVLELQVQHVDTVVMTEGGNNNDTTTTQGQNDDGDEQHDETTTTTTATESSFTSFWVHGMFSGVMGVKNSLEKDLLPTIVQRKISTSIREMIEDKLEEKKMAADVDILQEDKQARFFFERLKQVRIAIADEAAAVAAERAKRLSAASAVATSVREGAVSAVGQTVKLVRPSSDPTLAVARPPPPSPSNIHNNSPNNGPSPLLRSSTEKRHRRESSFPTTLPASLSPVAEVASLGASSEKAVKPSTKDNAKENRGDSEVTRRQSFPRSLSNVVVEAASVATTTIKKAATSNKSSTTETSNADDTTETPNTSADAPPDSLSEAVEAAAAAAALNKANKAKSSSCITTDSTTSRKGSAASVTSVAATIKRGTASSAASVASAIRKSPNAVVHAMKKASFSSSHHDGSTDGGETDAITNTDSSTTGEGSLYDSLSAAAAATFNKQSDASSSSTQCAKKHGSMSSVASVATTIKRGSVSSAASVATTMKKGPKALAKAMKKASFSSQHSSQDGDKDAAATNTAEGPSLYDSLSAAAAATFSKPSDDSPSTKGMKRHRSMSSVSSVATTIKRGSVSSAASVATTMKKGPKAIAKVVKKASFASPQHSSSDGGKDTVENTDSSKAPGDGSSLCDSLSTVVEAATATFHQQQSDAGSEPKAPPRVASVAASIKKGCSVSSAANVAASIKRGSVSSAASVATTVKKGPKALAKAMKGNEETVVIITTEHV